MPPQDITPAAAPIMPAPQKMGKWKASKTIVKESWAMLQANKQIVWFPIASSIVSFAALLIMVGIIFFLTLNGSLDNYESLSEGTKSMISYGSLLIYYVVMFFIVNFFQSGILISVDSMTRGERITFKEGMSRASHYGGKLFLWSLISATVGVILRLISDRSKLVGKIIAGLLGAAWNIMTYFSLPSLIIGNSSIGQSFKESAALIRKTWGETFIVNVGVGFFFGIIALLGFLLCLGIFALMPGVTTFIVAMILFVLFIIVISVISSTLNIIFKFALYQYAKTGTVPPGFTAEVFALAVKK